MTLFENTYIRAITLMSCISLIYCLLTIGALWLMGTQNITYKIQVNGESHVVCKANNFMYCQYTYNYIHVYITGLKKESIQHINHKNSNQVFILHHTSCDAPILRIN